MQERQEDEMSSYKELKILTVQESGLNILKGQAMVFNFDMVKLVLKANKISVVQARAFLGMSNLQQLDLSGNKLKSLPGAAFKNVISLNTLKVNDNEISAVSKSDLSGLSLLEVLFLRGNRIDEIDPEAFKDLDSIEEIHLNHNLIKTFDLNLFARLSYLRLLNMANNKVTKWITPQMQNYVAANNGDEKERYSSAKLSIKDLILANNDLTTLSGELFEAMPHVETLDISHNALKSVAKDAFTKLSKLKVLDLSHNQLTHPEIEWVLVVIYSDAGLESDMSNNPWTCDCHTAKYEAHVLNAKFLGNVNKKTVASLKVQCHRINRIEHDKYSECFGNALIDDQYPATSQYSTSQNATKKYSTFTTLTSSTTEGGIDIYATSTVPTDTYVNPTVRTEPARAGQTKPLGDSATVQPSDADKSIPGEMFHVGRDQYDNYKLDKIAEGVHNMNASFTAIVVLLVIVIIFVMALGIYAWKYRSKIIYRVRQIIADTIERISISSRSQSSGSSGSEQTLNSSVTTARLLDLENGGE